MQLRAVGEAVDAAQVQARPENGLGGVLLRGFLVALEALVPLPASLEVLLTVEQHREVIHDGEDGENQRENSLNEYNEILQEAVQFAVLIRRRCQDQQIEQHLHSRHRKAQGETQSTGHN